MVSVAMGHFGVMPQNGMSHVAGPVDKPLIDKTIPTILKETVARVGSHEAAIFPQQNIRWSYQQFDAAVDDFAGGLHLLGFVKGDRVGIWAPNRCEWLVTQFATARIGVILVNINPAYRIAELEYALNKVGCKGLVIAPAFKKSNYVEILAALAPELTHAQMHNEIDNTVQADALKLEKLPHLTTVICMGDDTPSGMVGFDDVMTRGSTVDKAILDEISACLDPHDPINIQFTSGTTGQPKGACLTHHNIVNNANFVMAGMAFSQADRLCIPVPFYHCFGMVMGTLGCVVTGASMVIPSQGFDPLWTLKALDQEKCTAMYGVPTMFVAMLERPDFADFDFSQLRTGIMAGAPCPIEIMKRVQVEMNMTGITIAYGMTETSPVSFQSHVDDPLEKRVTTVGRIHPHVEVKLVDENFNTVGIGEQGHLLTRGYCVMQGYWADDEETARVINSKGWMHTGDLAILDDEGYCKITGRVKDMICRGGENIYPREIEEFLYTHPAVSQVQVFGIPDERYGEVSCVLIIKKPDAKVNEEDIRSFCKEYVAHYKMPAHIRFVDEIPMTVTGKPQKFLMRDYMIKELGIATIETA